MKYCFLIIAVFFVSSACSSNTTQNPNSANAPTAANSTAVSANSTAATNSNPAAVQAYNGAQNLNPNAFNATNDNLKVIKTEPKKDELPYGSRNAPDDSVIATASRGKEFVETRTFKNHPVLAKLEKIMDANTTKYKVYLKNGKVLDAAAEKITSFATMAPVNILIAVGIEPKPPANTPTAPVEKKDQNQ